MGTFLLSRQGDIFIESRHSVRGALSRGTSSGTLHPNYEFQRCARPPPRTCCEVSTMKKRALGKTGESLSVLGFGGILLSGTTPALRVE